MRCIIVISLVLLLASCGAKQKTTYRVREADHVTRSYSYNLRARNDIKSNVRITKMGILPVDPTRPASYTDPSGQTHELNNAKIDFETSEEETEDNSTVGLSGKSHEEGDYSKQGRETESWIFRVPLPLTIGIGIALIAGIIFLIYRKT